MPVKITPNVFALSTNNSNNEKHEIMYPYKKHFPEKYPEMQKRPKTDIVGKASVLSDVAQTYGMLGSSPFSHLSHPTKG